MGRRNRKTLKNYFSRGKMPTEEHFGDMIDSMLNIVDEGFDKSAEKGVALAPLNEKGRVAGIYRDITEEDPLWSIEVEKKNGSLTFRQIDNKETLTLDQEGRVGIGQKTPCYQLETSKTVGLHGRAGTFLRGKVRADGQWHDITDKLKGCWALEVIAGCGKNGNGSYALAVVTAIHCFGAKKRIDNKQSWYGTRCKRIKFRWSGGVEGCVLQVKTRCDYGAGVMIQYNISKLWDDPLMLQSNQETAEDEQ
ncbi:hypothetical protein DMA11_13745 [Marinilabiliaceae bacterium JC017]|nr:hypothetical protein DMA11_13745 [Marinilabiliaceae bacterium JC017]